MLAEWVIIGSLTGLGMIVLPPVVGMPAALRARSRRRRGLCINCAYDLTGNVSGVCPECGTNLEKT